MNEGWDSMGFTADEAVRWFSAGFSPSEAGRLRQAGVIAAKSDIELLGEIGATSELVDGLLERAFTVSDVRVAIDAGVMSSQALVDWLWYSEVPAEDIPRWIAIGFCGPPDDRYADLPAMPLADAEQIVRETGLGPSECRALLPSGTFRAGIGDLVVRLHGQGFSPAFIRQWLIFDNVFTHSEIVKWATALRPGLGETSGPLGLVQCSSFLGFSPAVDATWPEIVVDAASSYIREFAEFKELRRFDPEHPREFLQSLGSMLPALLVAIWAKSLGLAPDEYKPWQPLNPATASRMRSNGEGVRDYNDAREIALGLIGASRSPERLSTMAHVLLPPTVPATQFIRDWDSLGYSIQQVEVAARFYDSVRPSSWVLSEEAQAGILPDIDNASEFTNVADAIGMLDRPATLLAWMAIVGDFFVYGEPVNGSMYRLQDLIDLRDPVEVWARFS